MQLIGFLLPAKVHIERSLIISASQKSVFEQVNVLKNWEKWSPWLQMDTTIQHSYSGPTSGVGATYNWKSDDKNIGNGSISIIYSIPSDSLLVNLDYGDKGKSTGKFLFEKVNQGTKVIWSLESDLGMNPVSRWFGLFMDRMAGPDLENGLSNIDELLKDIKVVNGFEIINYEVPARVLLSVRDTASPETVTSKLALMYMRISHFMKLSGLPPTGAPLAIFHNYSSANFDIEACIPIATVVTTPVGINCIESDAQKTIMVRYFGSYKSITSAYLALQTYIKDKDLQPNGPSWEEYVTDPASEADSTKWQTNIYYPVK
jgi:effector-binding domain-containing protein